MTYDGRVSDPPRFRRRGIWYRSDRPFHHDDDRGTLALDTTFRGVRVPAGSLIWRDEDDGDVNVQLTASLLVDGTELPSGTHIDFHGVRPRGAWAHLAWLALWSVLFVPFLPLLVLRAYGHLTRDRSLDDLVTACAGADCTIRGRRVAKGQWFRLDEPRTR